MDSKKLKQLKGITRTKFVKKLHEDVNNIQDLQLSNIPVIRNPIKNRNNNKYILYANNAHIDLQLLKDENPTENEFAVQRVKLQNCAPSREVHVKNKEEHPMLNMFPPNTKDLETQKLKELYGTKNNDDDQKIQNQTLKYGSTETKNKLAISETQDKIYPKSELRYTQTLREYKNIHAKKTSQAPDQKKARTGNKEAESQNMNQLMVSNSNEGSGHPLRRRRLFRERQIAGNTTMLEPQQCAHCRQTINNVAFFNGTQQLCGDCAERHYKNVTAARFQSRRMGYNEFKNVGGDTIYLAR